MVQRWRFEPSKRRGNSPFAPADLHQPIYSQQHSEKLRPATGKAHCVHFRE